MPGGGQLVTEELHDLVVVVRVDISDVTSSPDAYEGCSAVIVVG